MLKWKENSAVTVTQVEPEIWGWQEPWVDILIATCTIECHRKFGTHVLLHLNFRHFVLCFYGGPTWKQWWCQPMSGPTGAPYAHTSPGILFFSMTPFHISTMFTPKYVFLTSSNFLPWICISILTTIRKTYISQVEGICFSHQLCFLLGPPFCLWYFYSSSGSASKS